LEEREMRLLCLAILGTVLLLACGPVDYLSTVTLKATRALAEARTANAERLAPYEYWSAVEYLRMAKEMAAYADYLVANKYGEEAAKMATDARRLAAEKAQAGPAATATGSDESPPDLPASKQGGNP
jgi:hypothetical protein